MKIILNIPRHESVSLERVQPEGKSTSRRYARSNEVSDVKVSSSLLQPRQHSASWIILKILVGALGASASTETLNIRTKHISMIGIGSCRGGADQSTRRWERPINLIRRYPSSPSSTAATVKRSLPRTTAKKTEASNFDRRTSSAKSDMNKRVIDSTASAAIPVSSTTSPYSTLIQPREEYSTRKQKSLSKKLSRQERQEVNRIQKEIQTKQQQQHHGGGKRDLSLSSDGTEEEPSLEEMKRQLGFGGRLVADAVEVTLVTAGSYISGGMLGLVGGGVFSLPNLFKSTFPPEELAKLGLPPKGTPNFLQKCKYVRNKSFQAGHSWATLSASFSGFHALVRCVRGGAEDRWTSIISSGCAGAFMSRQQGPQAMMRGAATFAGLTYIIDFIGGGGSKGKSGDGVDPDFDFDDYPLTTTSDPSSSKSKAVQKR